jgi:integrase
VGRRRRLVVHEAKTDAGTDRRVDLSAGALDELREWKARSLRPGADDPVFVSRARTGVHRRQTKRNVEARLKATIKRANEKLSDRGIEPISEPLSGMTRSTSLKCSGTRTPGSV